MSCSFNSPNISIVFFDHQDFVDEKTLKKYYRMKNIIFIYKEISMFEKPSLDLKKS